MLCSAISGNAVAVWAVMTMYPKEKKAACAALVWNEVGGRGLFARAILTEAGV
jgi:hypothetical protein